jgi:hypothetical protein
MRDFYHKITRLWSIEPTYLSTAADVIIMSDKMVFRVSSDGDQKGVFWSQQRTRGLRIVISNTHSESNIDHCPFLGTVYPIVYQLVLQHLLSPNQLQIYIFRIIRG